MSGPFLCRSFVAALRGLFVTVPLLWTALAAAGSTWDGGDANDNNWTSGTNWDGLHVQSPPPNNGAANLVFAGTTRLTPNLDANWSINSLTFDDTAGAFTIGSNNGSVLTIGAGGITNQDNNLQTLACDLVVAAPQTWDAGFLSNLAFTGDIAGSGAADLTILPSLSTQLSGRISGLDSLTVGASGILVINGATANTFTGVTRVNAGVVHLNKSVANGAIPGNLIIGDGVGFDRVILLADEQIGLAGVGGLLRHTVTVNSSGELDLNGHTETLDRLVINGGVVRANQSRLDVNEIVMTGGSIPNFAAPGPMYVYESISSKAAATTASIDHFLDLSQAPAGLFPVDVEDGAADVDLSLTDAHNRGILKTGAGTLRLAGETAVAPLYLSQGAVQLSSDAVVEGTSITVETGAIRADGGTVLRNPIYIIGTLTFDGPLDLYIPSQPISGAGSIVKAGPGTLTFGGTYWDNTYSGLTAVNEGTLVLDRESEGDTIFGNLIVGDGLGGPAADVVRVAYIQQIRAVPGNLVRVNSSGWFDVRMSEDVQDLEVIGGLVTANVLGVNSLSMTGGEIAASGLTGKLKLGGNLATSAADGPARIGAKVDLLAAARTFTVADGLAEPDIDVTGVISNGSLIKAGPGTLRLSAANTFAGGLTHTAGVIAIGNDSALGAGPVNLQGGTLQSDGLARTIANSMIVASGAVDGPLDLTFAGTLSIAGTLEKRGAGGLVILGPQTNGLSLLRVLEGSLAMHTEGGAGLAIEANAPTTFHASQHLRGLDIDNAALASLAPGGNHLLRTAELMVGPGAALDLADGALVVQANAITRSAIAGYVEGLVASGFASFAWNGAGIYSSAAASDATFLTALGVMLNDDGLGGPFRTMFAGEPVDANSVLVKYTYYGDADLSGIVDGTDYALIDNGFNSGLSGWFNGDFDYSGAIDGTDYALIDNAFNSQTGPLSAGSIGPAVPEPGTLALGALAALLAAGFGRARISRLPATAKKPGE